VAFADLASIDLKATDPRVEDFATLGLVEVRGGRLFATLDGRRVLDRLTAALA
jgi:hypothetical protein